MFIFESRQNQDDFMTPIKIGDYNFWKITKSDLDSITAVNTWVDTNINSIESAVITDSNIEKFYEN